MFNYLLLMVLFCCVLSTSNNIYVKMFMKKSISVKHFYIIIPKMSIIFMKRTQIKTVALFS